LDNVAKKFSSDTYKFSEAVLKILAHPLFRELLKTDCWRYISNNTIIS